MPGKGQRRREKNYRAAHGADTRLPPPPKQRELDALPSKLCRPIVFQNKQNGSAKADADVDASSGGNPGKQGDDGAGKNKAWKDKKSKKWALEPPADAKAAKIRGKDGPVADENMNADGSKGKRKQGKAMDLRFKELYENVSVSKKQKRKKHLDEKKKRSARAVRWRPVLISLVVKKSNLVKLLMLHQSCHSQFPEGEESFRCFSRVAKKRGD